MNQQAAGSKIAGQNPGAEQPASPGESGPSGGANEPIREQLRRKLFAERKAREGQESQREQPGGEGKTGQAPEGQDDDPRGADEHGDDPNRSESPGGDDHENPDGEELDDDPDGEDPDGEDPDGGDEPEALTVDDRQYTADDIRNLEKRTRELDASYRRKTQVMSRQRQEYEAHGREIEEVGGFFQQLANANLQQLEAIDPESLSQEEFGVWKQQVSNAKAGRDRLLAAMEGVKKRVKQNREKMLDQQAAESAEVLKGIDPRWNNEFYGKIRDFAVESGRYSAEEFADVTDWRTMEGLIALHDMAEGQKRLENNKGNQGETREPPTRRRRRKARQPRNDRGQFTPQNTEKKVFESTNAKADGSLRNHFQARLAAERGRK